MENTYSRHASVCARFYTLVLDHDAARATVIGCSGVQPGDCVLFVGSMFDIADCLLAHGAHLTIADLSPDMVRIGRARFPAVPVQVADLRRLPDGGRFDMVFVVGRVFTHMLSDADLRQALASCRRVLKPGGRLFFDNYDAARIERTTYFNGELSVSDHADQIVRVSTTTRLTQVPFVVRWDATYKGRLDGTPFSFSDSIAHRAWSRPEIIPFLQEADFELLAQGDNFDETSFFTLARAI